MNATDTMQDAMKILFVDDEENVLRSIRRLFMDEDYYVMIANSGEEGLEILKQHPDMGLIVSDQRMPGLTGVEFLAQAREIVPDALRILLTGYADINAVVDAINRGGAYRYLTKPWDDKELIQAIHDAAEQSSLKRENKRLQGIVAKQNEELKNWNSQLEFYVQEQTLEIQKNNQVLEKMNTRLKTSFKNTITAFSGLLELRDKRTGSHSKTVAEISVKTAGAMGLKPADLETITVAALLHDIGKIGMSDTLFIKAPDEMNDEEKKEYIKHPVRGQAAIDSVEDLRAAGRLIRHHHESFDGTGFPDGLRADKIPIGARIIAAADFYEHTVRKMDVDNAQEAAMLMMKEQEGAVFDPAIFPHMEPVIMAMHAGTAEHRGLVEMEIGVDDLRADMVIAREVRSGTGITLVTKGTTLNSKNIQALKRYYRLDPSHKGIFVLIKR